MKVVQNVKRTSENIMSVCQYVRMQLFSIDIKKSCSEYQKDVRKYLVSMPICQNVSIVRMQLFSLGIKI